MQQKSVNLIQYKTETPVHKEHFIIIPQLFYKYPHLGD